MSFSFLWSLLVKDPLIILATAVMGTISVITSFADPEGRRTDAIARAWARLLLRIAGVRVSVAGREQIAPGRSYVFAGNHRS